MVEDLTGDLSVLGVAEDLTGDLSVLGMAEDLTGDLSILGVAEDLTGDLSVLGVAEDLLVVLRFAAERASSKGTLKTTFIASVGDGGGDPVQ